MEYLVEGGSDLLNLSMQKDDTVFLRKNVENKVLSSGGTFTGELDAVTGELLHGSLLSYDGKISYEGPFLNGKKHGDSAICRKVDGTAKYVGSYNEGQFLVGTLITKDYTYSGEFAQGDFSNPIFHGKGLLAHINHTVYEGEFREGIYEGHGVLTTTNGSRYDGKFCSGKKSGLGTMQYKDGSSYTGDWELDLRHGEGVYSTENNTRLYRGEFAYDKPCGSGRLTVNGVEMIGMWNHGQPVDGAGWKIRYLSKGLLYKGRVKCGKPHGNGSLFKLPSSQRSEKPLLLYTGNFMCGLPTPPVEGNNCSDLENNGSLDEVVNSNLNMSLSQSLSDLMLDFSEDAAEDEEPEVDLHPESCAWSVKFKALLSAKDPVECPVTNIRIRRSRESNVMITLMDGSEYFGAMTHGVMEGRSTFSDSLNESVFTGNFHNGLKHGPGEERYNDGTMYKGNFHHGWKNGFGELLSRKGNAVYVGEWKDDMKHGKGTCIFPKDCTNPGRYKGDFHYGQRHGSGALTAPDGTVYEGDWSNDHPLFGDWVIHHPDGSVYMGPAAFECENGPPVATGSGSQRESDGSFYTGTFLHGQRNGHGVCLFATGETWDGKWDAGVFVKYGRTGP